MIEPVRHIRWAKVHPAQISPQFLRWRFSSVDCTWTSWTEWAVSEVRRWWPSGQVRARHASPACNPCTSHHHGHQQLLESPAALSPDGAPQTPDALACLTDQRGYPAFSRISGFCGVSLPRQPCPNLEAVRPPDCSFDDQPFLFVRSYARTLGNSLERSGVCNTGKAGHLTRRLGSC